MLKDKPINFVVSGTINRHVLIEITKRCNLNCRHCFTTAGERMEEEMNLAEWKIVAKDLTEVGFDVFTISGGEPLLEIDKAWGMAKELRRLNKNTKIYLFSNGLLVNHKLALEIKEIFNGVMISLDGNKTSHDWLRRKEGSYEAVIKALNIFRETGVPVSLQSMVTEKSMEGVEELVKTAKNYGVKAIRLSHVDLFGRARDNKKELTPKRNFLAQLNQKIEKLAKENRLFLTSNLVNKKQFVKDRMKFRQPALHILANGLVLPWYGFTKEYELVKYPIEGFGKMTASYLTNKLIRFNELLDLAEKKMLTTKENIIGYDNIIASYLFSKKRR
jgi:MoaA/NifB/PqqE/SkfB family radical SAM enzyme